MSSALEDIVKNFSKTYDIEYVEPAQGTWCYSIVNDEKVYIGDHDNNNIFGYCKVQGLNDDNILNDIKAFHLLHANFFLTSFELPIFSIDIKNSVICLIAIKSKVSMTSDTLMEFIESFGKSIDVINKISTEIKE